MSVVCRTMRDDDARRHRLGMRVPNPVQRGRRGIRFVHAFEPGRFGDPRECGAMDAHVGDIRRAGEKEAK